MLCYRHTGIKEVATHKKQQVDIAHLAPNIFSVALTFKRPCAVILHKLVNTDYFFTACSNGIVYHVIFMKYFDREVPNFG